jgi:hypothetical protein
MWIVHTPQHKFQHCSPVIYLCQVMIVMNFVSFTATNHDIIAKQATPSQLGQESARNIASKRMVLVNVCINDYKYK